MKKEDMAGTKQTEAAVCSSRFLEASDIVSVWGGNGLERIGSWPVRLPELLATAKCAIGAMARGFYQAVPDT